MKRLVVLAAVVVLAASRMADGQVWRTVAAPDLVAPYTSPTVVMYPHSRVPNCRYRGGAPGYAAYRGGVSAGNPFPPAYVYGGYGFGGPAGLAGDDWAVYRQQMAQQRAGYQAWLEGQRDVGVKNAGAGRIED